MKKPDTIPSTELFRELAISSRSSNSTGKITFEGTTNQRSLRALDALLVRPIPREQLDRIAGCSNGPDLIRNLRALGLGDALVCHRVPGIDRDGFPIKFGVYALLDSGKSAVRSWLKRRG